MQHLSLYPVGYNLRTPTTAALIPVQQHIQGCLSGMSAADMPRQLSLLTERGIIRLNNKAPTRTLACNPRQRLLQLLAVQPAAKTARPLAAAYAMHHPIKP
jgi:hypothetical protein